MRFKEIINEILNYTCKSVNAANITVHIGLVIASCANNKAAK